MDRQTRHVLWLCSLTCNRIPTDNCAAGALQLYQRQGTCSFANDLPLAQANAISLLHCFMENHRQSQYGDSLDKGILAMVQTGSKANPLGGQGCSSVSLMEARKDALKIDRDYVTTTPNHVPAFQKI